MYDNQTLSEVEISKLHIETGPWRSKHGFDSSKSHRHYIFDHRTRAPELWTQIVRVFTLLRSICMT